VSGPGEAGEPVIARDATYYRAPGELRKRVRASLGEAARAERRPYLWRLAGIGIACVAAASITWNVAILTLRPSDTDRIAEQVLAAHVRSLMAPNHLADVASTDTHTVKPWFAGKLDFSPPVADYSAAGFELTGGRLDYIDGHPAAALTYRHRLHVVNLFVWPAKEQSDAAPRVQSRQGYGMVGWVRGGLRFCAISDMAPADLAAMPELVALAAPSPLGEGRGEGHQK
jgi:anti-sigma factor RsiW